MYIDPRQPSNWLHTRQSIHALPLEDLQGKLHVQLFGKPSGDSIKRRVSLKCWKVLSVKIGVCKEVARKIHARKCADMKAQADEKRRKRIEARNRVREIVREPDMRIKQREIRLLELSRKIERQRVKREHFAASQPTPPAVLHPENPSAEGGPGSLNKDSVDLAWPSKCKKCTLARPHKCCPTPDCGAHAETLEGLIGIFGTRRMRGKLMAQSYCRRCRKANKKKHREARAKVVPPVVDSPENNNVLNPAADKPCQTPTTY